MSASTKLGGVKLSFVEELRFLLDVVHGKNDFRGLEIPTFVFCYDLVANLDKSL